MSDFWKGLRTKRAIDNRERWSEKPWVSISRVKERYVVENAYGLARTEMRVRTDYCKIVK